MDSFGGRQRLARTLVAGLVAVLASAGLVTTTTAPAHAGQVGVTVGIQGAGGVTVVEGTLEDGSYTCNRFHNTDHRITDWCPRVRNSEVFEAWVWLRGTPPTDPGDQWVLDGWTGCDETRERDGVVECGVHSGAFSSDERYPVARFRDTVPPRLWGDVSTVPGVDLTLRYALGVSDGVVDCRVDGVTDWATCVAGDTVRVPEGRHRVLIRATDSSGNETVDPNEVAAIDTRITAGPSARTGSPTARFGLSTVAGSRFSCSLDGAAWSPCGEGQTVVHDVWNLAAGDHTLLVQARYGEWVDPVPARWSWTVDLTAPTTTLTREVSGGSAVFTFDADEPASFRCRLESPRGSTPWEPCASPVVHDGLSQGSHAFSVRATDPAGNEEPAPPVHAWTVDTVAPTTTLVATTTEDRASFAFRAEDAERFECRLTGPGRDTAWTTCTSPTSYAGLAVGEHRFEVRAVDAAGNVEPMPRAHVWTATARQQDGPGPVPFPHPDMPSPDTALTSGPSGFVLAPTASFTLAAEPGWSFRCALDGAAVPCGASLTLSGLRSGTHTLTAAAVDARGEVDPTPAVRTWTVPVGATQLRAARGWRLRRSPAAYDGSRLEATRRGSRLTHRVSGARSVALVVGTGRRHGTVKVYAGTRLLRTVRLASRRSASQVLVPVSTFATPYTGRLRVVVATQGRPVRLEGLGVATG